MAESQDNLNRMRIEVMFDSPKYGSVACLISIVDEVAIAKFGDIRLARDMFYKEKEMGNLNQQFNERLSCIIEKFPGQSKEQIAKDLILKFNKHNITIKEKK